MAKVIGRRASADLGVCQSRFDEWRVVDNTQRPYQVLDLATPTARYRASPRHFRKRSSRSTTVPRRSCAGSLWAAGVPAAIVNPRAVRRFAEAMGIREKTNRIDTGVIRAPVAIIRGEWDAMCTAGMCAGCSTH